MIINCECGKKKFNIDDELIPEKGRLLKCGSCDKIWHYTPSAKNEIVISQETINNEVIINEEKNSQLEPDINISQSKSQIDNIDKNDQSPNENKDLKNKTIINKNKKKTDQNFLSLTIVFLILFIALIFVLDTFKLHIANFFPDIIVILDNLYATLHDLILFFKDLFN